MSELPRSAETPDAPSPEESRSPVVRLVAFATVGFIIAGAILFAIASSIKPEENPGYALTDAANHLAETGRGTLDVKDRHTWTGFSFLTGKRLTEIDPADLLGRRHHLRAPGGAMRLGDVPREEASRPSEIVWEFDKTDGSQTYNPAFGKWYTYSYFTHMLEPISQTHAVRTADGSRVVFVRLENYYCKPEGSGCLTIRYRLGPQLN